MKRRPPNSSQKGSKLSKFARARGRFRFPSSDDPYLTDQGAIRVTGIAEEDAEFLPQHAAIQAGRRSWNWLDHGYHPIVRDQGGWNACSSYASVAMIEARRMKAGKAPKELSPGFLHNCLIGETNSNVGHNISEVLNKCIDPGAAVAQSAPLPVSVETCQIHPTIHISGWYWTSGATEILDDLVANGPSVVTMLIDESFDLVRGDAVYEFPSNPTKPGNHALLLVGYDLDEGYVLVQHSGGVNWGRNGVGRVRIGSGGVLIDSSSIAARLEASA